MWKKISSTRYSRGNAVVYLTSLGWVATVNGKWVGHRSDLLLAQLVAEQHKDFIG